MQNNTQPMPSQTQIRERRKNTCVTLAYYDSAWLIYYTAGITCANLQFIVNCQQIVSLRQKGNVSAIKPVITHESDSLSLKKLNSSLSVQSAVLGLCLGKAGVYDLYN